MKKLKTLLKKLTPLNYFTLLMMFAPMMVNAAWYDPITTFAKDFNTGIIIVGGLLAVGSMVYVGSCWLISRMAGTMETTAMDYVKHIAVVGAVGGAVAAASWAYQLWGGKIS